MIYLQQLMSAFDRHVVKKVLILRMDRLPSYESFEIHEMFCYRKQLQIF